MKLKPTQVLAAFICIGLVLITQILPFMKNANEAPLIIFVGENDHGDMSYGSLLEQMIKDCYEKGLSTKTFSEFPLQSTKSQKQTARTPELMSLQNSPENVEKTAKFLDGQFIEMGSIQARYPMFQETWGNLPEGTTPEQLVQMFESNVDNPQLLEMMRRDLATGETSGQDKVGNLENFYDYWRSPLHYRQTHAAMVGDIRVNLATSGTPDVIFIMAGSPHLPGINEQLSQLNEFRNSKKLVIGNFPRDLDSLGNILFGGTPEACETITGKLIGFEVDWNERRAIVPGVIREAIDEKSQSKAKSDYEQNEQKSSFEFEQPTTPSSSPRNQLNSTVRTLTEHQQQTLFEK